MRLFLLSFILLLQTQTYAQDLVGQYTLLSSEDSEICPEKLVVDIKQNDKGDDLLRVSIDRGSMGLFLQVDFNLTTEIQEKRCYINKASGAIMFDTDSTVCVKEIIKDNLYLQYSCRRYSTIFGTARKCNPEKRVKNNEKRSGYASLSVIGNGNIKLQSNYNKDLKDGCSFKKKDS